MESIDEKTDEKMAYEYWLGSLKLPVNVKKKLREQCGNAEALYYIEEMKLIANMKLKKEEREILLKSKKEWKCREEYQKLKERGIRWIPCFSKEYPEKLKNIAGSPYALFVKGSFPDTSRKSIAIVGARRCSSYGEKMALQFSEYLAARGIQIISGMARGIDGAGHRGALNGDGLTFAVLGCGVDICYPRENKGLYGDLERRGGLISEYPPGTAPLPMFFPARNRIISGLSDLILVMEAKERSGSLITADMALEQGKDVYALPGPVTSELSRGCNLLIKQGAGILLSPRDLLSELQCFEDKNSQNTEGDKKKNKIMLESKEKLVYSQLDLFARNKETILCETKLPAGELTAILTSLEIKGYIREVSKNYYTRI